MRSAGRHAAVMRRARFKHEKQDAEHHGSVRGPVNHECLHARDTRLPASVMESDQQITRKADALPAGKQQQIVVREHQHLHHRHEEVEPSEEPVQRGIMPHVSGRVDVNQRADTRNQQHEFGAQRIEQQPPFAAGKPGAVRAFRTDDRAMRELPGADCRDQRTEMHQVAAEDAGEAGRPGGIVVDAATEEQHRGGSEQRQARNQPERGKNGSCSYHFRRSRSSARTVPRFRNSAIKTARPTAASETATAITISAKIWPSI